MKVKNKTTGEVVDLPDGWFCTARLNPNWEACNE